MKDIKRASTQIKSKTLASKESIRAKESASSVPLSRMQVVLQESRK